MKSLTNQEFIERAKALHGEKYAYAKVVYTGSQGKVTIVCPTHGLFEQRATNHLSGQGCPKCGVPNKLTPKEFIEKAQAVHGTKYMYQKTEYVSADTRIKIMCPTHGEFTMLPKQFLKGEGCLRCKRKVKKPRTQSSNFENHIISFMKNKNII